MTELVKLYLRSIAVGFFLSAVFAALVIIFNIANIGHLVFSTSGGIIGLVAFWVLNGIVFSGVQFGYCVMSMSRDDEDDDEPRGGTPIGRIQEELVPIPVKADTKRTFGHR